MIEHYWRIACNCV